MLSLYRKCCICTHLQPACERRVLKEDPSPSGEFVNALAIRRGPIANGMTVLITDFAGGWGRWVRLDWGYP